MPNCFFNYYNPFPPPQQGLPLAVPRKNAPGIGQQEPGGRKIAACHDKTFFVSALHRRKPKGSASRQKGHHPLNAVHGAAELTVIAIRSCAPVLPDKISQET